MGASGFRLRARQAIRPRHRADARRLVPLTLSADDLAATGSERCRPAGCKSSVATASVLPARCCSPIAASAARRSCRSRRIGSRAMTSQLIFMPADRCRCLAERTAVGAARRGVEDRARRIPAEALGAALCEHRTRQPAAAPIFRAATCAAIASGCKVGAFGRAKPKAIAPRRSPLAASTPTNSHRPRWSRRSLPGLYFIGEVVDVTGHLGGFNFQWAWASGYAAGQVV